ncbi:hypothetical protein ACFC08_03715 [Streptomyces sp. NPDC056112]|uniref:hypothetical protein n=1 Tax=unclassified Streptomyces TaxID=2593676 RepID=UPI001CD645DE|nr:MULTISPECIES: hypothetical protein [unclassified Streptomyces]
MTPLTWLLIPLAAVFMTSVWGLLTGRPRRTDDMADVERYDRLRAALARAAS